MIANNNNNTELVATENSDEEPVDPESVFEWDMGKHQNYVHQIFQIQERIILVQLKFSVTQPLPLT